MGSFLDAELKARDGFRTRLVGLLAFGGAPLALAVNAGRQALDESLGCVGEPMFFAVLLVIGPLLVLSLNRAVRALAPQEEARFSTEKLLELGYATNVDDGEVRRRVYRVTAQLVDQEAAKNDRFGKELQAVIVPLRTALLLSAAEVLILALRGFGV